MPKVSVIIPTFNRADYIREAIDSVLQQTFADFEIVVVDDGSTDGTKDIIQNYNGRLKYFYQDNGGVSSARNKGIRESAGEYIALLDSDDIWFSGKLAEQVAILDDDKNIGLVASYMELIDKTGRMLGQKKPKTEPADNFEDAFFKGSAAPSTFLIRRECFEKVGMFDENITAFEDLDIFTRIAREYTIKNMNKILGGYRIHDANITNNDISVYMAQVILAKKWMNAAVTKKIKKSLRDKIRKYSSLVFRDSCKKLKLISAVRHLIFFLLPAFDFQICKGLKNSQSIVSILFYEPSSGFGGSSNSLYYLLKHIDKSKYKPVVIYKNAGPQFAKIDGLGIQKIKLGQNADSKENNRYLDCLLELFCVVIPEAIKITRLMKKEDINIVHINTNIISGMPAIIAAKLLKIPCLCHIRQTRALIKYEKFFVKWVDKFIVLNNDALKVYGPDIPVNKMKIIYNGIDLKEFAEAKNGYFRSEFNLSSFSIVGLVGRIVNGKGQKEFILAAKEVLCIKPDVKFVIVGDAKGDNKKYFEEVKALVIQNNLTNDIIFTGWRDDIKNIVSDFDILIQPTTFQEGFGLTIIEAMALNKPVIATRVAGPKDIVVERETGYLIEPGDINAMAERIIYLLNNRKVSQKMGDCGKKLVIEKFSIEAEVKKIEAEYEMLLKN